MEVLYTITNEVNIYNSIREAAKAINYDNGNIVKAFNNKEGINFIFVKKKRYKITKLEK